MKKINVLFLLTLTILCSSCKKEKEDYRDVWTGSYDLAVTVFENYGDTASGCGDVGITTYPRGYLLYKAGMPENKLLLECDGYGLTYHVFTLADKNGTFISSQDGENYEKGYVKSDGTLFYEKQERVNEMNLVKTTIKGEKYPM